MASFITLLAEVHRCTLCSAHLPLGPRPVLQVHPQARILIAAQAPGRKVHETGIPFTDASGERLRTWMGMDAKTFYDPTRVAILPMGFCYPGTGKSGDLPPRPECALAWRKRVLSQMHHIRLTLVIGSYAKAWHLPDAPSSLTETVRVWQRWWPEVLPLPHPSPRNNLWLRRNPWFEQEVLPVLQKRIADLGASHFSS